MSDRVWSEIVAAHEDAARLVAAAFAERGKTPDLVGLRGRLRRRLDDLHAALSPLLSAEEAVRVLVPLVFLLDEQVEGRLAVLDPPDAPVWHQLQRDLFPDGDGGDAFYEHAGTLLVEAQPSPVLVGVHLFCLQAGFHGRLIDNPGAIPAWKARLAEKLPVAPQGGGAAGAAGFRRARSAMFYVLAAVGALVVWQVVLVVIARVV